MTPGSVLEKSPDLSGLGSRKFSKLCRNKLKFLKTVSIDLDAVK